MSVVSELIRTEADGTISFGNYELPAKSKKSDFEHDGDLYKVKTFKEITKITVELEEETSYQVFVDDKEVGEMKTNLGGKLVLSVELDSTESAAVRIEKM